ncbi:Uncharacterized protein FKW44_018509, partial [Caligus rogercresseyi]
MKAIVFLLFVAVHNSQSADLRIPHTIFCSIINHSPRRFYFEDVSAPQFASVGDGVEIYCKVTDGGSITENRDWKYCTWARESDESNCKSTYVCKGELCYMELVNTALKP